MTVQWHEWDALLAMEYLDPEDKNTGNRLPRRVKKRLSLDINRDIGQFSLGGRVLAEGDRFNDAGNFKFFSFLICFLNISKNGKINPPHVCLEVIRNVSKLIKKFCI